MGVFPDRMWNALWAYSSNEGNNNTAVYNSKGTFRVRFENDYRDLYPERIIFNGTTTICYWNDGSKTVVKCKNDQFSEEVGVLQCIARRMFNNNRSSFLRYIEEHAYHQPDKQSKKE